MDLMTCESCRVTTAYNPCRLCPQCESDEGHRVAFGDDWMDRCSRCGDEVEDGDGHWCDFCRGDVDSGEDE